MESKPSDTTIKLIAKTWNKNKSGLYDFSSKDIMTYMAFISTECRLVRKANIVKQVQLDSKPESNEIGLVNIIRQNGIVNSLF
jgi:hypothetical protein